MKDYRLLRPEKHLHHPPPPHHLLNVHHHLLKAIPSFLINSKSKAFQPRAFAARRRMGAQARIRIRACLWFMVPQSQLHQELLVPNGLRPRRHHPVHGNPRAYGAS